MAKYRITPSSKAIIQLPISIGHKAEKGVEAIEFDVTAWVETYGSGTLTVIMRRWGDAIPYPIALEIDENNKATWTLSDIDTAKAGMAYAQLSYVVGDEVVKKSDIYTFRVMDSLTGEGDPPEAYESWLEHLTHLAAEAMAEVLDIEGIVTDKTLSVDGGIADAKATGDALSALEDQFSEETDQLKADLVGQLGIEAILMVANKYIDLSGSTVTMSGGFPAYSGTSPAYSCGIISCEPGDDAIISGTGGGQTRLWGFVDSSGNILEKADSSSTAENLVITAPANTAFLIVHTNNDKISYKGFSKIDSVEKSTVNMLVLEQGGLRLADGVEKEMTTRVRTITKVTKPMRIVCPTGIIVSGAFYYNTADGSFNSAVAYKSQIVDINIVSGTYARLVFAKADTTADISVSDMVGLDTITVFYNDIEVLKLANKTNIFNAICLEMGGINVAGVYVDSTTRVRTVTKFTDNVTMTCPDGIVVFRVYYFNISDDTLSRFTELRTQYATISPASGEYAIVIFSKTDITETIDLSDIKGIDTMEMFNARLDALEDLNVPPMVEFSYDHDLYDCTATMTSKPYSNDMTAIYRYFDELVSGHSDYVSKTDIAETLGLAYPTYANGNYDSTPAYKTYMYSFVCANENVNTPNQTKKKLLLIGATHGDEQATPYNLYIFAKRLCEEFLTNDNIFKLRSTYDIYIIPVLNGYGYYNTQRVNGNGVDINRNYPIAKWTEANAGNTHYTGASAGSEFETQIIMGVIENYNLNILIDHHNYAYNLAWQFYTEVNTEDALKLSYQSAVDCSYAFKKNLPAYFGTNFDFVINRRSSAAPGALASDSIGTTSRYAYEQGVPFSATVEISNCINYLDGVHANTVQDLNGETTFSVGQYTLLNQVLRYGQYALVR